MSKMNIPNPWQNGPTNGELWIPAEDQIRIDRENSKMLPTDGRRVHYTTPKGRPYIPAGWSGNPWKAPILLLLLNPAYSNSPDAVYDDPAAFELAKNAAMGNWCQDYPNPYLHPRLRQLDSWCAKVPYAGLHKHLTEMGVNSEDAWKIVANKMAILELSPWASSKWSPAAFVETTRTCIALAQQAMNDSNRIVLLGRGLSDWKSAGLLDADVLPLSRGVRSNQSRVTKNNFPQVWDKIISELKKA